MHGYEQGPLRGGHLFHGSVEGHGVLQGPIRLRPRLIRAHRPEGPMEPHQPAGRGVQLHEREPDRYGPIRRGPQHLFAVAAERRRPPAPHQEHEIPPGGKPRGSGEHHRCLSLAVRHPRQARSGPPERRYPARTNDDGGDNISFNLNIANTILDAGGYTAHYTGQDGGQYRAAANDIPVSFQTSCYQCESPPNVTKTITAGTHLNFTLAIRPPDGFPEEKLVADYIQAEWKNIGIEFTVKMEPSENALSSDVYGGRVETYIWYWSADPDPNYILSMQSSWTLDGWSDNYWNNATYNHYYLKQLSDQNPTTREADVKAAQKIEYESAVYIIYIFPYGQWAMRTDLWQGRGDWTAHPYRQMNAYWGANPLWFDLNCPSCVAPAANQPPTPPVITGSRYPSTYTGVNLTLSATSSDAEATDLLNWTWTWGDSNSTVTHGTAANPTSTYGHIWTVPGNYTVRVSVSDGYSAPVFTASPVYVNVTTPPSNLGTLQGTVKDTSGNPIAGAQVIATPGNRADTTTSAGAYSISLSAQTYTVTATAPLFSSQAVPNVVVSAGATTWRNFTLTPNVGWIITTVTDQRTGAALGGAVVLVSSSTGVQKTG